MQIFHMQCNAMFHMSYMKIQNTIKEVLLVSISEVIVKGRLNIRHETSKTNVSVSVYKVQHNSKVPVLSL